MPSTRLLAIAIAVLAVPASASAATTYTVNPGEKIQDAVNKASPGDTILIKAGTYSESVSVSQAGLTFTGEPGATVTTPSATTDATPTFSFTATSGDPDVMGTLILINATGTGPVIQGPDAGLILRDSAVLAAKGDGVDFGGSDKNLVQRSSVLSLGAKAAAISAGSGDAARTLTIDSTTLTGKTAALSASYAAPTTVGAPGITVSARHVTAIGDTIADASSAQLPLGASPIAVTYVDSIVRGKRTATASSGGVAATITADPAKNSVKDDVSDAAALFVAPAKFNFHLRADAPVIGKGQFTSGESDTDIDGQPRANKGISDLGADEFVDRAPKAALSASSTTVRQNQTVTLDASTSSDPDAGDAIASYKWDFGDGQSATTTTPTTTHTYANQGGVDATVTVVDKEGISSDPAKVTITVTDGVPPTLKISSPFNKQKIRAYKGKRRLAVQFFGSAMDDKAMGKVYLAMRPVAKAAGGQCRWFDGKRRLKTAPCTAPTLFEAKLTDTRWLYKLPTKARLRKGVYYLLAVPVDASGLPGTPQVVKFRIR